MKIGIIAALPFEVEIIKNELSNLKEKRIASSAYYSGNIDDVEIVIMQCGMGKVSAALGTQALISEFHPDFIINTGCAGALDRRLKIGDIVLSTQCVEWDLDTIAIGNPRGFISGLDLIYLDADLDILKSLKKAIKDRDIYEGLIVSGDEFVSKDSQREIIFGSFKDALCCEMEGAAVAHVCVQNNVPFCVLRTMSDTADHDSTEDFATFAKKAGKTSAHILLDYFKSIK